MDTNTGCTPLTINFTNLSSNSATNWEWYFGNGDSTNVFDTSYTYQSGSNFYPTLAVYNYNTDSTHPCIGISVKRDTIVLYQSATAIFSANSQSGCLPFNVQFTNSSFFGNSYYWNFGDGDTSTAISPSHIYTTAGHFTDTLIAYGVNGCNDTSIHYNYIATQVRPNVIANFSGSPLSGCDSLDVQFNNTSTEATFYLWKFGDGGTNSITNPSYNYTHPGNYLVTLIAYNMALCGLLKDTFTIPLYVTVFPPPNIVITQSGDTLSSNFSTGNQWYKNGVIINGETNQTFVAHSTGCYQTTYTDSNGCSNISNIICVNFVGINEITIINGIIIYPNPMTDKATVIINGEINSKRSSLVICNLLGEELQRIELPANQGMKELSFDRKDIPNGLYFYKIVNNNSEVMATGKLIFR